MCKAERQGAFGAFWVLAYLQPLVVFGAMGDWLLAIGGNVFSWVGRKGREVWVDEQT